jgi:chaperone required for assembly of F1-ATPase
VKPRKRYYKSATVIGDGPFTVALDGRPLRTPYKHPLLLDQRSLAEAIAAEWQMQGSEIQPYLMKHTSLAFTAIDHIAGDAELFRKEIVRYSGSDLVCYRANEPSSLVERQAVHWDPILDNVRQILGVEFIVVHGVVHEDQPSQSLAAVADFLKRKSMYQVSAIYDATTLTGSALIAICLAEGRLTPEAAWTAAHVDEDWQNEQWGQDLQDKVLRDVYQREFCTAAEFLALASGA